MIRGSHAAAGQAGFNLRMGPTLPAWLQVSGLLWFQFHSGKAPLIEVAGWRTAGFDAAELERRLGVSFDTTVPDGCARR